MTTIKKVFKLLPNIKMRETITLGSQNEKKWTKAKKIVGLALAATLLFTPTLSTAQETNASGQKQDKKEIVQKTSAVEEADSTIAWDEAVSWSNLVSWKISQEEIQEYLRNHKEELVKHVDEETAEAVYKEVMGNKRVQGLIEDIVNRDDIKQAALEGNEEYIQQEVNKSIEKATIGPRLETLWSGALAWAFVTFIVIMLITSGNGIKFGRGKKS